MSSLACIYHADRPGLPVRNGGREPSGTHGRTDTDARARTRTQTHLFFFFRNKVIIRKQIQSSCFRPLVYFWVTWGWTLAWLLFWDGLLLAYSWDKAIRAGPSCPITASRSNSQLPLTAHFTKTWESLQGHTPATKCKRNDALHLFILLAYSVLKQKQTNFANTTEQKVIATAWSPTGVIHMVNLNWC